MKRILVATALSAIVTSAAKWDRDSIVSLMEKVADWQLANPAVYPEKDWTQATWYQGAMALSRVSSNSKYFEAMKAMADNGTWTLGPRTYEADDHNVGQTYLELFLQDPNRQRYMFEAVQQRFDFIIANPANVSLDFTTADHLNRWSWADSLFMAPPAWVRTFHVTRDASYLNFMDDQWFKTSDYLWDQKQHFFYRDSTFFNASEANGKSVFWSRGNGWVVAGLARVLEYLPRFHPTRPRYENFYHELTTSVLAVQPEDGIWRMSLLDPDSFDIPEESGTGLFTFGLLWGLNNGMLDPKFCPNVLKAWEGLASFVQDDGKLTHVQPIGWHPVSFDVNNTETFGVGAFLLAGEQLTIMSQKGGPCSL
jgi:unsaturated rhamnogalacturonyl hydrolase